MRKVVIAVILFMMLPVFSVYGMEKPSEDAIEIFIRTNDCINDVLEGYHLDILVQKEDVPTTLLESPNDTYLLLYGSIETIDYLEDDDPVWISYSAFVEGAKVYGAGTCYQMFAYMNDEYKHYSRIKIVYFDDFGDTIYMSDVIEIPIPEANMIRHGLLNFYASEPYHVDNGYMMRYGSDYSDVFFTIITFVSGYFLIVIGLGIIVLIVGFVSYFRRRRHIE